MLHPTAPLPAHVAKLQLICAAALLCWLSLSCRAIAIPAARIYQQKCAHCHGQQGEGVQDLYDGPLFGDESIDQLAQRITTTMPEDDPESCVGQEAHAVAAYIYRKFYSPEAQRKLGLLAPARRELVRMTVPQYRNAVADLIAGFTPPPHWRQPEQLPKNGLRAEYFKSRQMNKTEYRQLKRVDTRIDFDFGQGSPAEGIPEDQFAIIWQGSLRTHKTGHYEFRIRTPNGVRLYLNADPGRRHGKLRDDSYEAIQKRLIDAWVSSGEMRELTSRMFLLGGREYPLRLEFFKFKDPAASIQLEWKPPHGVWSVIDAESLSTGSAARTFVVDTPFPADDHSVGYERGSSVSQEWHDAVANAALATSAEVTSRLPLLTGIQGDFKHARARLAIFLMRFASTAFRRPLTVAEQQLYRETLFEGSAPEVAVRRGVLLVLTSPHFLYTNLPSEDQQPNQHELAARLAFALRDSLPDEELRRLADLDRLATPAQIESQAARMLNDPQTRFKLQGFFRHWLELEERDLAKDQKMYPDFDEAVIADLRRSLELFVDQVVWSPASDYRELLLADYLLLNGRLQQLYADAEQGPGDDRATRNRTFEKVSTHSEGRCGILTHPYLLSAFAYHNNTSPIHRGVFLTRNIVGRQLKPPPVAVAFEDNEFAPNLTMREKVTELTRDRACLPCHEVINPLGFALENFDAVGRWRNSENNKPIDTKSDYTSVEGTTLKIDSARDIAKFAIGSPAAQRAFIRHLFQHMVKQSPEAYGVDLIERLRHAFVADEFHIRKLMVRIASFAASAPLGPSDHSETTWEAPNIPAQNYAARGRRSRKHYIPTRFPPTRE